MNHSVSQLAETIRGLGHESYRMSCSTLGGSSVGQHVRHIVEMFQCLMAGYETGTVDYEARPRDASIETDPDLALSLLEGIAAAVERPDRELVLEGVYSEQGSETLRFDTNYRREVVYNLEHTIHHMALIRVGLREISDMDLPEGFGVASATVKHRRECAP